MEKMKKYPRYTDEQYLKDLKELKESGTCPVKDPKFYEPWDMKTFVGVYKRDLSQGWKFPVKSVDKRDLT